MLKEIRYKGVSLTPSDYECTDGELMYSDGITIEGGGIGSLEDLGITATAEELNYMSGVTSSVQTQINSLSTDKVDVDRTWGGETTALPSFE